MAFRTVVVKTRAKIETRLGYLVIRSDEDSWIFINEINTLIIESASTVITCQALLELSKNNVNVVFCNEKHLPYGQLMLFNANFNTSGNIKSQTLWEQERKESLWQQIIYQKLFWQEKVLLKHGKTSAANIINEYIYQILPNDKTNREGHAAKVYFNALFGMNFSRRDENIEKNSALNYAYAILMSAVAREISACGYSNHIGIWHDNQFNDYNLACDLMEPFRPIIDDFVLSINTDDFKTEASKILSIKLKIGKREFYLDSAIELFVRSASRYMKKEVEEIIKIEGYEI